MGKFDLADLLSLIMSSLPQGTSAPTVPTPRYTRYVLFMIVLIMMLNTVDRHIVSILLDDIKADLSLTDRQLGWILLTSLLDSSMTYLPDSSDISAGFV